MGIIESAYDFSVRIAEIVRYMKESELHFSLESKLLDCGVYTGLCVREGNWKSAADYIRQADYIIEMAAKSGYLTEAQICPIRKEANALLKLLHSEQTPKKQSPYKSKYGPDKTKEP